MDKAYDFKDLGARLKAKGLIEAEDMAVAAYGEFKAWLIESATMSETPFDNLVIPFLGSLDAVVMPEVDKIDGAVG